MANITVKEKLLQELTYARYNVLVNSTDGSFTIPKGFEGIWNDPQQFFEAVKEQAVWHINEIYAFDQLSRIQADTTDPQEYALLEETIARYIDLTVHSAKFKERINAYSLKLEQGYSYEAKDLKVIKPTDIIPKTIISALNNTGIRPQIEAYDIREGEQSDQSFKDIEPWEFIDNLLSPSQLKWADKYDTIAGKTLEARVKVVEDDIKNTHIPNIQELQDKTQNITTNTTANLTEIVGSLKNTKDIQISTQDDKEYVQVKPVRDLAGELRQKDKDIEVLIKTNNTSISSLNNDLSDTKNKVKTNEDQIEENKENIQVLSQEVGNITLFEAPSDHSKDVDGVEASQGTKEFTIEYIKIPNPNFPDDRTKDYIPQRVGAKQIIEVMVYKQNVKQNTLVKYLTDKTSVPSFSINGKSFTLDNIEDITGSETFKITISGTQTDLATLKIHQVEILTATQNGQAITQAIADARYAKKAELGNYQVNVGLKEIALPAGDKVVIKETGHFSSNDISGVRQEATEDYHLIDLQKVKELIEATRLSKVEYGKGRTLFYDEVQTGTIFENTVFFAKYLIKDGYTIVGGTDGTETTGELKSHHHTLHFEDWNDGWNGASGTHPVIGNVNRANVSKNTSTVGGSANLPAGIKLLKVVYIAKKDITVGEIEANETSSAGQKGPARK